MRARQAKTLWLLLFQAPQFLAALLDEGSIMGHEHHGPCKGREERLEGLDGCDVQMIRGLIEDEYVRLFEQGIASRSFLISPGLVSFPSIIRTGSELSRATCERTSPLSF